MKLVDTIRRGGRSLRNAKLRTLLTALALAVGGFTLSLTLAASNGARHYTSQLITANFDPSSVIVSKDDALFSANGDTNKPQEYSDSLGSAYGVTLKLLNQKDIKKIAALPHVQNVLESYQTNSQYITRDGAKKYTGALNVYNQYQKPSLKFGAAPKTLKDGQALMPDTYLPLLKFSSARDAIGKQLQVRVQRPTGESKQYDFKIVGVTTKSSLNVSFDATGLYVSQNDARNINDFATAGTVGAGKVASVSAHGDGIDPNVLKQEIVRAGYAARTSADAQKLITQIINVLQIIILVFGFITLVASFFGVVNTQYISVLERTREIGLMKALGMSRRTVSALFVIEATWIGFIGAVLGSVAAVAVGSALNPWISKKINFGHEHLLIFDWRQIALLILFLMLVTTIAGLLPARKAAKLDPIEALRTE